MYIEKRRVCAVVFWVVQFLSMVKVVEIILKLTLELLFHFLHREAASCHLLLLLSRALPLNSQVVMMMMMMLSRSSSSSSRSGTNKYVLTNVYFAHAGIRAG